MKRRFPYRHPPRHFDRVRKQVESGKHGRVEDRERVQWLHLIRALARNPIQDRVQNHPWGGVRDWMFGREQESMEDGLQKPMPKGLEDRLRDRMPEGLEDRMQNRMPGGLEDPVQNRMPGGTEERAKHRGEGPRHPAPAQAPRAIVTDPVPHTRRMRG